MSLLSLKGVEASYGVAQALFGVDLDLPEGEVMAPMGRNGMGKSTTVKVICRMLAGSGDMSSDHIDGNGEISIAGSGSAKIDTIAADSLEISIAGSGDVEGSGAANTLDASIAGSGSIKLAGVKFDTADISIAGSGDVAFASDGTVEASIVGSGDVEVTGSATCTVSALGSGKLRCSSGAKEESAS